MRSELLLVVPLALPLALVACEPVALPDDEIFVPIEVPACNANADGRIDRDEMPFVVGAVARNRIGINVPVDVDGEAGQGSARVWDLSRPAPEDEPVGLFELEPASGHYFSDDFPGADVAGPLEAGNGILGPLLLDDDAIRLMGAVSREENPESGGRTFMSYEEPVTLYPFPLELGASVTTTTQALNAVAAGIPLSVEDTYTITVGAHGEVVLPDLILEDALRVTIRLERVPVAGIAVQQVSHVFVNECVGEVARFVSDFAPLTSELPDNFAVAKEVRRLSF